MCIHPYTSSFCVFLSSHNSIFHKVCHLLIDLPCKILSSYPVRYELSFLLGVLGWPFLSRHFLQEQLIPSFLKAVVVDNATSFNTPAMLLSLTNWTPGLLCRWLPRQSALDQRPYGLGCPCYSTLLYGMWAEWSHALKKRCMASSDLPPLLTSHLFLPPLHSGWDVCESLWPMRMWAIPKDCKATTWQRVVSRCDNVPRWAPDSCGREIHCLV